MPHEMDAATPGQAYTNLHTGEPMDNSCPAWVPETYHLLALPVLECLRTCDGWCKMCGALLGPVLKFSAFNRQKHKPVPEPIAHLFPCLLDPTRLFERSSPYAKSFAMLMKWVEI